MNKINAYNDLLASLPEGKRLPDSLTKDLRSVSESLEKAQDTQDVDDILQKNALLRNRIAAAAGVAAAQVFDRSVNELKKQL